MCLPLIAAGVAAAGTIAGGMSALQQGNYQAAIARQNSQAEIQSAHDSVTAGQKEALQFYRQVGQAKGQNVAAMAANGIDVGFGSAERAQEDTQQGANEDAANLYHNIEQRTKGNYVDAMNYVQSAKAAKMQGRAAFVGSLFQAGSTLMGGMQQNKLMKAKLGGGGGGGSYIRGSFGSGY